MPIPSPMRDILAIWRQSGLDPVANGAFRATITHHLDAGTLMSTLSDMLGHISASEALGLIADIESIASTPVLSIGDMTIQTQIIAIPLLGNIKAFERQARNPVFRAKIKEALISTGQVAPSSLLLVLPQLVTPQDVTQFRPDDLHAFARAGAHFLLAQQQGVPPDVEQIYARAIASIGGFRKSIIGGGTHGVRFLLALRIHDARVPYNDILGRMMEGEDEVTNEEDWYNAIQDLFPDVLSAALEPMPWAGLSPSLTPLVVMQAITMAESIVRNTPDIHGLKNDVSVNLHIAHGPGLFHVAAMAEDICLLRIDIPASFLGHDPAGTLEALDAMYPITLKDHASDLPRIDLLSQAQGRSDSAKKEE